MRAAWILLLVALPSVAEAKKKKPKPEPEPKPSSKLTACREELNARHVDWKPAAKRGIADAVEVDGKLGGIAITSEEYKLIIDCSLAVSLDEAGQYMRGVGFDKAVFASAYSVRNVRFTNHPSKHSFGLAIDISGFSGPDLGNLRVATDYEPGLGDDGLDCVGEPLTKGGAALKILQCQLVRSGLFHLVLSPDYDDAHHDHFHLEAKPWPVRDGLRSPTPAIH